VIDMGKVNKNKIFSEIRKVSRREYGLAKTPKGSVFIELKKKIKVSRVVITGNLNISRIDLLNENNHHFIIGSDIKNKKAWDSGNLPEFIVADGILLIANRGKKSKLNEIVILKKKK
jgi:hypothetical protein